MKSDFISIQNEVIIIFKMRDYFTVGTLQNILNNQ